MEDENTALILPHLSYDKFYFKIKVKAFSKLIIFRHDVGYNLVEAGTPPS